MVPVIVPVPAWPKAATAKTSKAAKASTMRGAQLTRSKRNCLDIIKFPFRDSSVRGKVNTLQGQVRHTHLQIASSTEPHVCGGQNDLKFAGCWYLDWACFALPAKTKRLWRILSVRNYPCQEGMGCFTKGESVACNLGRTLPLGERTGTGDDRSQFAVNAQLIAGGDSVYT
jgi:hypothetical protein